MDGGKDRLAAALDSSQRILQVENLPPQVFTQATFTVLWDIAFGNNFRAQPANTLFFAAGPNGEGDGLYGTILPAPNQGERGDNKGGNGQGGNGQGNQGGNSGHSNGNSRGH